MAYTSKYTGPEIDRRLEQGTYDDAVAAGFTGSKEEFYKQLAAYNPQEQEKLNNKQDKEDSTLETENKTVVGAINHLNSNKQDKTDDRLTTDSKIVVEAINEVKYSTIVLDQKKQPREDLGFSTEQKTVVGAVNELNLKIGELDESKQNTEDDRLDTNDTTVIGAINEVHRELDKLNSEYGQHIDDYEESITNLRNGKQDKTDYDLNTSDKRITFAINEVNDNLKAEIERSKTIDEILETLNIKQVTPDSENYASAYELQDSTGKVYGSRINITKDQFLKNVSYENNILTLTFILADGTESTQQVDLTGLVDEYIAGAGISVTTTDDGKKVINIADDALQKIQYADSEVRRLEQDKIPYAYDEKTQSNINVILPEGGYYLGNYGDENATIAKAAVYDGVKQLEIGSSKVHTNINTDSDVTIETSAGKKTIATTDELVNVVNIPIRSLQDKVYTQEEIFDWFGVTSVPELKQKISRGSQMYLRYGILLSNNPMYYKMPIEYTAFESANQIKLVFVGLNTRDDAASKYEIIINLDGTIIEGNSNVKLTLLSLEPDLSQYALKSEIPDISNLATKSEVNAKQDTLVSGTNIKTLNGESLLGEGNIQLDEGHVDYEALTNKPSINNVELSGNLSFEDLGLDINPTWEQIQNKPTFATVATSGDYNDLTDTPDLTVYQPITDNSLATSAKTIPAAINEIKESADSISNPYEINLTNLLSAQDSESISTAIGGIDNLNATVQDNRIIVGTISNGSVSVSIRILGNVTTLYYLLDSVVGLTLNEIAITNTSGTLSKNVTTHSVLTENMVINSLESDETTLPLSAAQGKVLNEKILNSSDVYVIDGNPVIGIDSNPTSEQISEAIGGWDNLVQAVADNKLILALFPGGYYLGLAVHKRTVNNLYLLFIGLLSVNIQNTDGTLSVQVNQLTPLYKEEEYRELSTGDKTIIGAINEINTLANSKADSQAITDAINALDEAEVSASTGEIISSVSQENGIVSVSKRSLTSDDIPILPQSKIEDLSTVLDAKQNATDATLGTTDKTIVGAINEISSKITGVGKPSFGIGGEVFNNYADNQASGNYAHAEGYQTTASGDYSHVEGKYNYDDPSAIHMVGIGNSNSDRKSAHVIKSSNGEHFIIGIGGYEGQATDSAQSLQEVVNGKQDSLTAGTGLEMTPERVLNVTLDTTVFFVAGQLPEAPTDEQKKKICLIPATSTSVNNMYTEYVWVVNSGSGSEGEVDGYWEEFGTYKSEVDLTDYLKSADAANTYLSKTNAAFAYLSKTDAASTYTTKANLTAHTGNTENPHNVTAAQIGLGNVNNTSDEDKPVSTAQQTALDLKQNITDNALQTTAKTIVEAINEVNEKAEYDTIILYSNAYGLTSWTTAYNNANSALALVLTNAFNNYNHIILRDGNKTDTTFYEYHVTQIASDNSQDSTKYFKYSAGLSDTTWWLITLNQFTVVIQNIQ